MFLWSTCFLALVLLCSANGVITSHDYSEPTPYPKYVDQFRHPDTRMLENIPASSKFTDVVRLSLHSGDLQDGTVGFDKERRKIIVAYGTMATYRDTYRTVFSTLWDGIEIPEQKLRCDEPTVTCSVRLLPAAGSVMGEAKFGSKFPGAFEVVARGTRNHSPVKNIWRLYSVPTLEIEEGRYFNIGLDFIQVAHKTEKGDIDINDGMMAYLNLEWKNDSDTVSLYGLPGVGELERINMLDIGIHQDKVCAHEESGCPQIKVNLKSQPWQGLTVGPSFEAAFSSELTSTDDRIAAAECVAKLYGAHIKDLRGLYFLDEHAHMPSGAITKIRGTVVSSFNDCDAAAKLRQITWPPQSALCQPALVSLKHDLNYWKTKCPSASLFGLQEMGELDPSQLSRRGGGPGVLEAQQTSGRNRLTVPSSFGESRTLPTSLVTSKPSVTAAAQTPSTLNDESPSSVSTKPTLPDQHSTSPEDANVIPDSADVAKSKSIATSQNHNAGDVVNVSSVASSGSVLPSAPAETLDIDNSATATINQFENDNGEDLSKPTSAKPFWSNLRDSSFRSRGMHITIILGFLFSVAVVVFTWQTRRFRKSSLEQTPDYLLHSQR